MYGLMKAGLCSHRSTDADSRRLHYCGTCKTMGRLYGQKSRFLLNNDAVFLAELLSALSADSRPLDEWDRAYRSYNCLALPATPDEMPLPLQVAAAATLVMSEFKLTDQIADGSTAGSRLALRVFSQSFHAAAERMKKWGFPVDEMWEWYRAQNVREHEATAAAGGRSAREVIAYVAEPTAAVTGLVFRHGGALVGCPPETQAMLFELGFDFGKLVYLLDALEDYEKDVKHGEFNALRVAYGLSGDTLPDAYYELAADHLEDIAAKIETALNALPLPAGHAKKFSARLRTNLIRRIGAPVSSQGELNQPAAACLAVPSGVRKSLLERCKSAASRAQTITALRREAKPGLAGTLFSPIAFTMVFLIALLFPRESSGVKTCREHVDIPLNLMSWGTLLNSLRPARLQPMIGVVSVGGSGSGIVLRSDEPPVERGITRSQSRRVTRVRPQRVGGGGCCCNDIACCDACCLCEQCGECACCTCECGEMCEACSGCGDCC